MAKLHWIDYAVLIAYFVLMLGIGARFAPRQRTVEEYLLANRSMKWLPVALSVMTAAQSAISYIGMPAWTYQHDMSMYVMSFPLLLVVPVIRYVFLPRYARARVSTAYEYLESRFNRNVRTGCSLLFLMSQATYLGIVVYGSSLVFSLITGLSLRSSILATAAVTIVYTTMGGIKAVIWTDVIQFFVKLGGVLITVAIILRHVEGGWQGFWRVAQVSGKLHTFNFSLDLKTPFTFWGAIIGGMFIQTAFYGTDQTIVQRFLTAKSARDEQKALLFQGIFFLPYLLLSYGIGVLLFVFYREHAGLLNPHLNPDNIFPQFIVQALPAGLSGLVIAAIFSAGMGTYSAAINSLSTVTVYDLYQEYFRPNAPTAHYVKIARISTCLWGAYTVAFALLCGRLGPLVTIDLKVLGPVSGILLGVFLLGMLTRRATALGVLTGAVPGSAATYLVISLTSLSFVWYTALGCILTFIFGYLASMAFRRTRARVDGSVRGLKYLRQGGT